MIYIKVFFVILVLFEVSLGAILDLKKTMLEDVYCPSAESCLGCGVDWETPAITEDQVLTGPDLCTVTLSWLWPFNSSFSGSNPRMMFQCSYENGDSCNQGNEDVCASCEQIGLTGLQPSLNPTLSFSNTCGSIGNFKIADNCLDYTEQTTEEFHSTNENTEPTTEFYNTDESKGYSTTEFYITDKSTEQLTTDFYSTDEYTEQSTTESYNTDEYTEQYTTEFYNTDESGVSELSTGYYEITTIDNFSCPSISECSVCPYKWTQPAIYQEDIPLSDDKCDVMLSWDYNSSVSVGGGPRVVFSCIYGVSGQYCNENAIFSCASCENVTLYELIPSQRPFVTYQDNCGFATSFPVAENCNTIETTPSIPDIYCPHMSECAGCPNGWNSPIFQVTGELLVNDTCDLTITWEWDYLDTQTMLNPSMTFQCIYGATGVFCEEQFHLACASCKEIVFHGINQELDPYIMFSDTCHNMEQMEVSRVCY